MVRNRQFLGFGVDVIHRRSRVAAKRKTEGAILDALETKDGSVRVVWVNYRSSVVKQLADVEFVGREKNFFVFPKRGVRQGS